MSDASTIAHVEGGSGTFVMPAHSPYERQILREHIARRVGDTARLTLGVHGRRWIITRRAAADSRCTACAQRVGRFSCSRADDTGATCMDCAVQASSTEIHGKRAHHQ